jgi:glyoxylase-like metal-dependent hydrolase (beta-lactamase superfamily II)
MTFPSLRLGDFELTIFSDGTYFLDGGAFFGIIPKALWQKKVRADEQNRVSTGLNSVLVRTGKQTVLIETGIGNKLGEKMQRIYEPQARLLDNLKAGGVSPDEIDVVINSHLHFDHCGWNTVRRDGKVVPTFPKATYYAQRGEWEAAREQRERDAISYISENYDPLIESGQMRLLEGDAEIVPGISARIYSGHTRWMQAIMIESRGQTACYISDLIPTTAHLDVTWGMAFDLYPLETIDNKKRFYAEAVPGKWLVIFTHDVSTPWAYVEELPGKRYSVRRAGE